MRSLLVFALVVLSGCSVFEDQGTPLPFQPVSSTPVADSVDSRDFYGVVASADEARAFRTQIGLDSTAVPELDWSREVLFVQPSSVLPNERLFLQSARLKRGALDLEFVIRRGGGPQGERRRVVAVFVLTVAPAQLTRGVSTTTRPEARAR